MIYRLSHSSEQIRTNDGRCKRRLSWQYVVSCRRLATASLSLVEHRVVVTWSAESGARAVELDGMPVASVAPSGPRGSSFLDASWKVDDPRCPGRLATMRVIAVSSKPNGSPDGFRCHDLMIDGISLLDCPAPPGGSRAGGGEDDFDNEGDRRAGSIADILYPNGVPELRQSCIGGVQHSTPSWELSPSSQNHSLDNDESGQEVSISPASSPCWREKIKTAMSVDTCDSLKTWVNDVA